MLLFQAVARLAATPFNLIQPIYGRTPLRNPVSRQFEHVSLEHPLSNDAVYAIIHDRYGYIWIGTEDQLNKFAFLSILDLKKVFLMYKKNGRFF